jgi:F0F1-type ATP synthase membrane subunit b/b'
VNQPRRDEDELGRQEEEYAKAAINCIRSELEEAIKNRIENFLSSVGQQVQDLHEELSEEIKDLQRHFHQRPNYFHRYIGREPQRLSWRSFKRS